MSSTMKLQQTETISENRLTRWKEEPNMKCKICNIFKYGYCKYKEHCKKQHVIEKCRLYLLCKNKDCHKIHTQIFRRFSTEKSCKFLGYCSYLHLVNKSAGVEQDTGNLDQKTNQHKVKIKINILEDELIDLNYKIKKEEEKKLKL